MAVIEESIRLVGSKGTKEVSALFDSVLTPVFSLHWRKDLKPLQNQWTSGQPKRLQPERSKTQFLH
jgi:hypothetical protein